MPVTWTSTCCERTLPHGRHRFYVCGPPAMMQTLVPALAEWGVPREDLHFEAFGPASVKLPGTRTDVVAAAPAAPRRSPFQSFWPHAGVGRPGRQPARVCRAPRRRRSNSGCRSGSCGTCETRLISGTVRYENAPDHDIAPGHCLLCVGRPSSRPGAGGLTPCRPDCFAARCCPSWLASRALVGIALLLDALLHVLNAVWIGRYLGIPGTLLIIGSIRLLAAQAQADPRGPAGSAAALARTPGLARLTARAGACRHPLQCDPGLARRGGDADQRGQRPDRQVPARPLAPPAGGSTAAHAPAGPVGRGARGPHLLGQPDLRRGQASGAWSTSRSRWPSRCWRWPTSSPCSCSGAGREAARLAAHRHRGQPGRC